MNSESDSLWHWLAKQTETPRVPGPREAESLFDGAQEMSLDEEQVDAIARQVLAGRLDKRKRSKPAFEWSSTEEHDLVAEGVLQLNRNKSDDDEHVEDVIDQLRKKALQDDELEDADGDDLEADSSS